MPPHHYLTHNTKLCIPIPDRSIYSKSVLGKAKKKKKKKSNKKKRASLTDHDCEKLLIKFTEVQMNFMKFEIILSSGFSQVQHRDLILKYHLQDAKIVDLNIIIILPVNETKLITVTK